MEGKATNILVEDEVVARATISKMGTNISIVKVKNVFRSDVFTYEEGETIQYPTKQLLF